MLRHGFVSGSGLIGSSVSWFREYVKNAKTALHGATRFRIAKIGVKFLLFGKVSEPHGARSCVGAYNGADFGENCPGDIVKMLLGVT